MDSAKFALQGQGYAVESVANEDEDDRSDRRGLVAASRLKQTEFEVVRLVSRNALQVTGVHPADDKNVSTLGLHLDDRSEENRLWQISSYLYSDGGAKIENDRTIIAGDFNAMHRDVAIARLLRAAGVFANVLPAGEPGTEQSKVARIGSLAQRLAQMADGRTMEAMIEAGFVDADPKRQPTIRRFGALAVQLDHIMVGPGLVAKDFDVANKYVPRGMKMSDHSPIVATIDVSE